MQTALALLTLLNAATPGIADLVLMIKKSDGTISVVTLLDGADTQFASNIAQAQAWMAAHLATPVAAK